MNPFLVTLFFVTFGINYLFENCVWNIFLESETLGLFMESIFGAVSAWWSGPGAETLRKQPIKA